jgi:diaminopimelate epimerase
VKVVHDAPQYAIGSVEAAAFVDGGNPHLVLLDSGVDEIDVARAGAELAGTFAGGINVEWVWPGPGPGELTLRVWERGAGETEACGTGSCAAAAAALSWARTGPRVVVHNPGGDVLVELGETAVLTGPAARIASVEMPWP